MTGTTPRPQRCSGSQGLRIFQVGTQLRAATLPLRSGGSTPKGGRGRVHGDSLRGSPLRTAPYVSALPRRSTSPLRGGRVTSLRLAPHIPRQHLMRFFEVTDCDLKVLDARTAPGWEHPVLSLENCLAPLQAALVVRLTLAPTSSAQAAHHEASQHRACFVGPHGEQPLKAAPVEPRGRRSPAGPMPRPACISVAEPSCAARSVARGMVQITSAVSVSSSQIVRAGSPS